MVFITAGMGGGTGTGAGPVVAEVARELGILTVAVVTKPFEYEGKRKRLAEEGVAELARHVDSLIIILNEKLEEVLGDEVSMLEAFQAADNVLRNAVGGIAEIINVPGLVNVDFEDVRTVMGEMGKAMMGSAVSPPASIAPASPPRKPSPVRCWKASSCPARAACWSTSPPAPRWASRNTRR
jgi:cell division protein FtsZ